ncbi:MAG: low molecular weight protein arginine phosphatase [candidate division Zixibacteria bacterium]|nr:low molecular weight protein arginine phosphatase [candidate division Zixibacteria bacterium]
MPDKKFKVLFVCTGNTCRSPMAEGIFRNMLKEMGIENIEVGSAGVSAADGFPASSNGVAVCRDWGIDISGHRSRLLDMGLIDSSDLILVMSPEHYKYIKSTHPSAQNVFLIKDFPPQSERRGDLAVEDPIGGPPEAYAKTFLELDEIIKRIFPHVVQMSKREEDNEQDN